MCYNIIVNYKVLFLKIIRKWLMHPGRDRQYIVDKTKERHRNAQKEDGILKKIKYYCALAL